MDRRIVVVGGGPAGWAAAAACCVEGLPTTLVVEDAEREWPNIYGVWADELAGLDLGQPFVRTWSTVTAWGRRPHEIARPYARIDNAALRAALRARILDTGGVIEERPRTSVRDLESAVTIDATGAPRGRGPAQIAYGVEVMVPPGATPPYRPGSCVLMDWRPITDDDPPSFLYAQDLGDGRWFFQETVLAAATEITAEALAARLAARLHPLAIAASAPSELVHIGLAVPIPRRPTSPVVAFGAGAAFVHPATGYSIATSLRLAPALAGALAEALRTGAPPLNVAHAGWSAVWPGARRRARRLEQYGMHRLVTFSAPAMQDFFDAFFGLGIEATRAYLSGSATDREVAAFMRRVFAAAPRSVRRRLLPSGR